MILVGSRLGGGIRHTTNDRLLGVRGGMSSLFSKLTLGSANFPNRGHRVTALHTHGFEIHLRSDPKAT